MNRRTALLGVGTLVGAYALAARPRIVRWGATDWERARPLAGDELIPEPTSTSTMAVTIDAPTRRIWPWLIQMGYGRAGWYSYDWIDNGGRPSAESILPELQELHLGERIPSTAGGRTWFSVEALEPDRVLVLCGPIDYGSRRSYDPVERTPCLSSIGTWAFVLEPLGEERTRLLVRTRGTGTPRPAIKLLDFVIGQPGHFVMQRKQLAELKRRAEGAPPRAPERRTGCWSPTHPSTGRRRRSPRQLLRRCGSSATGSICGPPTR